MRGIISIDEWKPSVCHKSKRRSKLAIVINLDHLRDLMREFLNEMEMRCHTTTFGPDSLTDWKFEAFLQWTRKRQENQ